MNMSVLPAERVTSERMFSDSVQDFRGVYASWKVNSEPVNYSGCVGRVVSCP